MIRYYDIVIPLGEFCIAAHALRNCHISAETMPLDWSGGVLHDKCGIGGLSGKIDLILNRFTNFFEREDFEVKTDEPSNTNHLQVQNNRTGLQYLHDFSVAKPFYEQFDEIKTKYLRRVERFYDVMEKSNKVCFFFMSLTFDIDDAYLVEQALRLRRFFSSKQIDFLFIINNKEIKGNKYKFNRIGDGMYRYRMNVYHTPPGHNPMWGNQPLYHEIIRSFLYSKQLLNYFRNNGNQEYEDTDLRYRCLIEISESLSKCDKSNKKITLTTDIKNKKSKSVISYVKYYGYATLRKVFWGRFREHCEARYAKHAAQLHKNQK